MIDTIAALSGLAAGVVFPPVTRRLAPADRVDPAGRSTRLEQDRFELRATVDETDVGPTYDRNGRLAGSIHAASSQTSLSPGADYSTATAANADSLDAGSGVASAEEQKSGTLLDVIA